ncbi:MAG: 1-deoxy-D-xylulose-5-phosphate reductoisomerase [candidate division WOR-3 bacterium]
MKIFLFGATGWIGRQVLKVLEKIKFDYEIFAITANKREDNLYKIFKKWKPKYAFITGKKSGKYKEFIYGKEKINDVIDKSDIIIFACSGTDLAENFFHALKKNKKILISNKEIIVSFGEIIPEKYFDNIIPLDSEHSSLFQLLKKIDFSEIEKIAITASGGPFFGREKLEDIKFEEVFLHPVWKMGKKITVDSATMMNKGLEIIEAHYLFKIPASKIEVIVHPQAIIHSFILTKDGFVFSNMFYPDMKYPILYALSYPERKENDFKKINFDDLSLYFHKINKEENKAIELAYFAVDKKNGYPAVLNFADEEAVNLFLKRKIKFKEIIPIVEKVFESYAPFKVKKFDDIKEIEIWTKKKIEEILR